MENLGKQSQSPLSMSDNERIIANNKINDVQLQSNVTNSEEIEFFDNKSLPANLNLQNKTNGTTLNNEDKLATLENGENIDDVEVEFKDDDLI